MSAENEILEAVRNAPREALPGLLGEIFSRLLAPPAPATKAQPIDEWLDVAQTAALLHVSKSFLYHSSRHGLSPRRIGKKLLFSKRELMAHLERNGGK